jgi:drug/metabolite transporter (DMT)-like permease
LAQSIAPSRWAIAAGLATVYLVWGSTYLAIKLAVESVPPLMMAGARFLLAGLLMYPIVRARYPQALTARNWGAAALIGGLLLIGGNGPVCWASQHVASGVAALIVGTAPLWFAVLNWLLLGGPRPTLLGALGLLMGVVGVYFVINPAKFGDGGVPLLPALALLSACFFWALGSLLSKRMPLPGSPLLATAMEMLVAGAMLVVLSFATGESARVNLSGMTVAGIVSFVYLLVFGSLVAFSAYVWLLGVCSPAIVSTYAYVNPLVAVTLGALLNSEPITPAIVLGACVIVASVVLITTQAGRAGRGVGTWERGKVGTGGPVRENVET